MSSVTSASPAHVARRRGEDAGGLRAHRLRAAPRPLGRPWEPRVVLSREALRIMTGLGGRAACERLCWRSPGVSMAIWLLRARAAPLLTRSADTCRVSFLTPVSVGDLGALLPSAL